MTKNLPQTQDTVAQLFNDPQVVDQLKRAMPKLVDADRLLRIAMTAIRTNPKLLQCTKRSLMACVMGCATLGLEPEPFLGQAYLVPYKNKWGKLEAQLIPGYRGYITLARRSGEVQSLSAQVVYENDTFDLQFGLHERLDHTPAAGDRGDVRGAYVIFRYKDGSYSFDYMPKADIDAIRNRSKASKSGPWVTDYSEMAKKTVIRRHVKIAPLSVEMARAAQVENIALGGGSQMDFLLDAPDENGNKIIDVPKDYADLVAEACDGDDVLINNIGAYVSVIAAKMEITAVEVQEKAAGEWENFWRSFLTWQKKTQDGQPRPDKTARNGDVTPPKKRANEMTPEELVINRIKKASKTTIERVVNNNWDAISASDEATTLAKAKWNKSGVESPWPGIVREKDDDTAQQDAQNVRKDEQAQKLVASAREQFGDEIVEKTMDKLRVEWKEDFTEDQINVDMAGEIYDRALEVYQITS